VISPPLAEESVLIRPVYIEMADGTVLIARLREIVTRRCLRSQSRAIAGQFMRIRVAFDAQEPNQIPRQQFRVGRTVRRVTRLAAFDFDRRVLEDERPLLVGMAFQTRRIAGDRIAQRFAHKPAVLIVAVGAFHPALGNFMVERFGEGGLLFGMTRIAEGRLGPFQQILSPLRLVRRMTIETRNAVTPVLAAAEVEALFAATLRTFVTLQTEGGCLRRSEFLE